MNSIFLNKSGLLYVFSLILIVSFLSTTDFALAQGSFIESQMLLASDPEPGDNLGRSVSVSGNIAIVGSPEADVNGICCVGKAYIFEWDNSTRIWNEVQILTASDGSIGDNFGHSVSMSGNYAVVGATDEFAKVSGTAYFFERNIATGIWSEIQIIPDKSGNFGRSVSIDGDKAIIGAPEMGQAFIYERNEIAGEWVETQMLPNYSDNRFGNSVYIHDNRAIVGAMFTDMPDSNQQGSAYIFEKDPITGVWNELQWLTKSDGGPVNDLFGQSVAISGDTAIVGAPNTFNPPSSVYVFKEDLNTGIWSEIQEVTIIDIFSGESSFIHQIAISGDKVVVGGTAGGRVSGAHFFEINQDGLLNLIQILTPASGSTQERFGESVSISDERIFIGASQADFGGFNNSGSAYVFEQSGNLTIVKETDQMGEPASVLKAPAFLKVAG